MSVDMQRLIAFADNELPDAERAEVEAALASDPALRAQLEAQQQLRRRLSAGFDPVLEEEIPTILMTAAQRPSNVLPFASAMRAPRWSVREWSAMAASLAGGLIIGLGVMANQSPMIAATDHGLVAHGALARALDTQLAADAPSVARMGISFRNQNAEYCRAFSLVQQQTAGIACKTGDQWQIGMTAHAAAPTGEVRTAASETPPQILSAIDASIEGDPLDAVGEARARASGWRAPERSD